MEDQEVELQELNGTVISVSYSNEENGYSVLRIRDAQDRQQTVVGCFPYIAPGEGIVASGTWVEHPSYGRQFKTEFANIVMPSTPEDIYEYLSRGPIKGLGSALAALIVERFGRNTLDILENAPQKLAEINGIGKRKAEDLSEQYHQLAALRRLVDYICSYGVRPVIAFRLYRAYGEAALSRLHTDPYLIASVQIGGTFDEADAMALELGFPENSMERVRAAVLFELVHNMNNGHCFIPESSLIAAACSLIGVEEDAALRALDELTEQRQIIRETVKGVTACYLPELYEAESYLASRLTAMANVREPDLPDLPGLIAEIEEKNGLTYAPAQREALEKAVRNHLLVITGGPGTGKTRCIRGVLDLYGHLGLKTLLAAPTGRAAKRMAELSGHEAFTVHRLLGAKYAENGDRVVFAKNESDLLECDAVILDESSMADLLLLTALLKAIPPDARLLLVGDCDQLPPVGPGNAFRGIIESGVLPAVRFTDIFRQSGGSRIVSNAHLINKGLSPDFSANTGDFFRLKRLDAGTSVETIIALCSVRLPERMQIPPEEIQVLSPTRLGGLGTVNLNRELQKVLNPPSKEKKEKAFGDVVFREGDRVMQIRNNYDINWHKEDSSRFGTGVYNGDIGYIRRIDEENKSLEIDFDGKLALCGFSSLPELEHAWAVTVHKSQGSEFRAVVFALSSSSRRLLTRSVLYTGVTRAKELLILVGDEAVAHTMIENNTRSRRYTFFKTRLIKESKNGNRSDG